MTWLVASPRKNPLFALFPPVENYLRFQHQAYAIFDTTKGLRYCRFGSVCFAGSAHEASISELKLQRRAAAGKKPGNELSEVRRLRASVQQAFAHKIHQPLELVLAQPYWGGQ